MVINNCLVRLLLICLITAVNTPPKGGSIEISLKENNDNIILTIADSGIGIPQDLLEKVKERFFRVDASRHTAGHGLGLSIVNAAATLHQGNLILENNNPGLKATLTLHGLLN